MPYLEWTKDLDTGIASIDAQHRKLVEMVNVLHDSAAAAECPSKALVEGLRQYAGEHFHIEEGYMQCFGYPGFAAHLREHEAFMRAVAELDASCVSGEASTEAVSEFLRRWLTEHILSVDMEMSRFLAPHLHSTAEAAHSIED